MSEHLDKNLPQPTAETAADWEGCRKHQLLIQRCTQCGHYQFYPRIVCTACMSDGVEWVQASGYGRVSSFTIIRRAVSKAYAAEVPYVIALIELEDLGFCKKGEAGAFVEAGGIELGGQLPVNTHGGMLSHCHPGNPGSMFSLTEAVAQLRRQAGDRQVADAELALVHGLGGIMSSHATMILGRERDG